MRSKKIKSCEKDVKTKKAGNENDNMSLGFSLLLEVAKDEYSKERERAIGLDNKTNIFISVMFAVLSLYVARIPFDDVKSVYAGVDKVKIVMVTVCMVVIALSISRFVIAFFKLFKVLLVKPYMCVNVNDLNDEAIFSKTEYDVAKGLLDHYNIILLNNSKINDDKAAKLVCGIKYCIMGFALLSVGTLTLLVVV